MKTIRSNQMLIEALQKEEATKRNTCEGLLLRNRRWQQRNKYTSAKCSNLVNSIFINKSTLFELSS